MVPILILAAGASTRMRGQDKLIRPVRGVPLLRDRVLAAQATGQAVLAALPAQSAFPQRWSVLEGCNLARLPVPDARNGMSASIRAGIAALPAGAHGVLILLADMPGITTADMRNMIEAFDGTTILRGASAAGKPGHPVLFPADLFPQLETLTGDQGARDLLRHKDMVRLMRLPGDHALTDLDTPEDWNDWSARS